ncbi:MAG: hypothetical protein GF421_08980 [Candidatus Aminicenantes bacterium]|nr:hypothetical protein [Candidatus Aminicenantes bacterium]
MKPTKQTFSDCLNPQFPHLLRHIRDVIEKAEKDFSKSNASQKESYLWEHTCLVSNLAYEICLLQQDPPLLPVIASLFHDTGKFHKGEYHGHDTPEEHISSQVANQILKKQGMKQSQIDLVTSSLETLYDENKPLTEIAKIVHDADFIAKSGHMGVAQFFIKSTLKGQTLIQSLLQSSSRELTYGSVLPQNMKTKAGRKMALHKKEVVLSFFEGLIRELNHHGAAHLEIKKKSWPCPRHPEKNIPISLVLPSVCPQCQEDMDVSHSTQNGLKCTQLVTNIRCKHCSWENQISFCIPEICP